MAKLRQTWDNSDFYTSSQDPRIAKTVEDMKRAIATLADLCVPFTRYVEIAETLPTEQFDDVLTQVRTAHQQRTEMAKQLPNLQTFILSILSVNSRDARANEWKPKLHATAQRRNQSGHQSIGCLSRASE